jgi:hypothetical protein
MKQVQEWLGHADPSFTQRTYVHLMDAGVGGAAFLDEAVTAAVSEKRDRPSPSVALDLSRSRV